jgi:hypothetical protein
MQRNFEPMRGQVERWRSRQLTDTSAKHGASPYRRPHFVSFVTALSLQGQRRCCTQELLTEEPLGGKRLVKFLERRRERIRQAPERARLEFRISWREVKPMHPRRQVPWHFQIRLDERGLKGYCAIGYELESSTSGAIGAPADSTRVFGMRFRRPRGDLQSQPAAHWSNQRTFGPVPRFFNVAAWKPNLAANSDELRAHPWWGQEQWSLAPGHPHRPPRRLFPSGW